jgi:hypothetical protein
MQSESTPKGTGPLRNGNPRGNPHLAPRCGAKTRWPRSGPCRGPAMGNGRCRMHGGLSTGPRTEEGLVRLCAARTKHGFYGAASQAALRRTDEFIAETRALLALLQAGAHPMDPIAPRYLRLVADAPPAEKVRRKGKSLCAVGDGMS